MAWFFAHIGPREHRIRDASPETARNELLRSITPNFFISAGGHEHTCIFHLHPAPLGDELHGWLVAGLGVLRSGEDVRVMDKEDWSSRISKDEINTKGLDGHFVILAWTESQVHFKTDAMGVRYLLTAKTDTGFALSSRYPWLSSLIRNTDFDFEGIGSYYLTSHQLGDKSLVQGVDRHACGAFGVATKDFIHSEREYWTGDEVDVDFQQSLDSFSNLAVNGSKEGFAIGLSGGIDSRAVLAARVGSKKDWAFTYDEGDQTDIDLASKLTQDLGMEHEVMEPTNMQADFLLENLKHTLRVIGPRKPAFTHLHFQHYPGIASKTPMMIHGSYGEVLREGLLANMTVRGKKALKSRDWEKIVSFINYYRPKIFKEEIDSQFAQGKDEGIEWLSQVIPEGKMSSAEMVEWIVLRVCLPFTIGWSQASDDEWFPSYSPLIQPSVIAASRAAGKSARHNGKGIRQFIKSKSPALAKLPLAKNNQTVPFGLGQLSSIAYLKMKGDKRHTEKPDPMDAIMNSMEEYIRDRLASQSFRESDYFNVGKIDEAVKHSDRVKLRWWLTFDTWRSVLLEKHPFFK